MRPLISKAFFTFVQIQVAPKFADFVKKSYKICTLLENFVAIYCKSVTYERRIDELLVSILPKVLAGARAALAWAVPNGPDLRRRGEKWLAPGWPGRAEEPVGGR
ncbi:hypothetical protein PWG14_13590 (plasmid) [Chromobacterium amazonense]|uniref:hypothetical protein n=1 Tax=Chromobacterium amazonense TaxID=1382803 RepID=UPI00237ECA80|nr:hypothetical protein [Chromobacterium amazonense]MDE1713601.1 hypothetical protein [Chromobacterium amazonense]